MCRYEFGRFTPAERFTDRGVAGSVRRRVRGDLRGTRTRLAAPRSRSPGTCSGVRWLVEVVRPLVEPASLRVAGWEADRAATFGGLCPLSGRLYPNLAARRPVGARTGISAFPGRRPPDR